MTDIHLYIAAAFICVLLGFALSPIVAVIAAVILIVHAVIEARKGS